MTVATTDWRTMPAGREMDALMAERVRGERIHRPSDPYRTLHYRWADEDGLDSIHWADTSDYLILVDAPTKAGSHKVRHLSDYSTRIAAAWRIIGTLHGNVERWDAFTAALPAVLAGMHATALHELEESQAALAICRAALAATEAHS